MRNEPCKKCGNFDKYVKGKFSYCRPCHTEAQKKYLQNKRMGVSYEHKKPPARSLSHLLRKSSDLKTHCPQKHSYSGDNVRIEQQNGRLHRRCRACERNAKRVKYGLAPEPRPVTLSELFDTLD